MDIFDTLIKRNKDFAVEQSASGLLMPALPRALPNVKALIIGCADMRVDPAHVLGIKPGEAVVMRNIGGRVTPGTLRMLGLLGRIGQVAGEMPGEVTARIVIPQNIAWRVFTKGIDRASLAQAVRISGDRALA